MIIFLLPELFVETLGDRQCVVGAAADYVVVVVVADYFVVVEAGTFESGCYGGKAVGSDVVVVADDVVVVVDDVVWPVGSVVAVVECQNALIKIFVHIAHFIPKTSKL